MSTMAPLGISKSVVAPQNPFELDAEFMDDLQKPERLIVDWIELTLLTALLVFGLPLNAMVLTQLLRKWYQRKNAACTKVTKEFSSKVS